MGPEERILAIRLSEKIKKNQGYAKRLGVNVEFKKLSKEEKENKGNDKGRQS